ncbi:MAG: hypothetical protein LBK01_04395 [Burkholderiaceae bacterium]|jgi:ABC-type enterochelin transport system permease subunit|nr:hypothetical protein [Burkholderiaceae bacterium]
MSHSDKGFSHLDEGAARSYELAIKEDKQRRFMARYERAREDAQRLTWAWHWLFASLIVFIWLCIDNLAFVRTGNDIAVALICLSCGLLAGLISRLLVMPLYPFPYAWLIRRIDARFGYVDLEDFGIWVFFVGIVLIVCGLAFR